MLGKWEGTKPKVVDNVEVNLVDLIWNWKSMSAALLKWRGSKGSQWNEECGAKSADDALKYVHLVLKPKDTDVSGRNKAHVEILQVSATSASVTSMSSTTGNRKSRISTLRNQSRPPNRLSTRYISIILFNL